MDRVLLDSFSEIKVPLATSEQVSPDVEREARSGKKQGSLCDVMADALMHVIFFRAARLGLNFELDTCNLTYSNM